MKFNLDGLFEKIFSKVTELLLLNFLFVVSSVLIVTIGTGLTSMYEITLKMVRNTDAYIVKGYITGFKQNLKKCLVLWSGLLVVLVMGYFNYKIVNTESGIIVNVLGAIFLLFIYIDWMIISYIFPLAAKFDDTKKSLLKNAVLLSLKHFPQTIVVTFLNALFPICLLLNIQTFIYGLTFYLIIGFALTAYINSWVFDKIFAPYYTEQQ